MPVEDRSPQRIPCPDPARLLPVPLEPRLPRPSLLRADTAAPFVSQLLAARARLGVQREAYRLPVAAALDAYRHGAETRTRRMPQGYRKTVIA